MIYTLRVSSLHIDTAFKFVFQESHILSGAKVKVKVKFIL
jgi:hypothetical protein